MPEAVDTVVFAPDDGWKYHPKHVEQFPKINELRNVASCWIHIRIEKAVSVVTSWDNLYSAAVLKSEHRLDVQTGWWVNINDIS